MRTLAEDEIGSQLISIFADLCRSRLAGDDGLEPCIDLTDAIAGKPGSYTVA